MKPPEPGLRDAQPVTPTALAALCGSGMPLPSVQDDGTVFAEPWQAHAFALTLQLHERGLFEWSEWAEVLSAQIKRAQAGGDPDDGSTYHQHWLNALEAIVIAKQIGTPAQIHDLEHAWEAAAKRTPHGQPIVLDAAATFKQ